jgi:prepilin-type N-terminal cleavage/methylation domain-containing protein
MNRGFTLLETLIALAVFCVAIMPLFPLISQANANNAYTEEAYVGQLTAQGILTAARDAAANNPAAFEDVIAEYVSGLANQPYAYGVWYTDVFTGSRPLADFEVTQFLNGITGKMITVMVWDEKGRMLGRTSGVAPE